MNLKQSMKLLDYQKHSKTKNIEGYVMIFLIAPIILVSYIRSPTTWDASTLCLIKIWIYLCMCYV